MRDGPLLLLLDEPTAALDAETEHELFDRFAAEGRAQARGRAGQPRGGTYAELYGLQASGYR